MERNTLLAIVLSILVMIGWFLLFPPPQPQAPQNQPAPAGTAEVGLPQAVATPVVGVLPAPAAAQRPLNPEARHLSVDTPFLHVVLTTQGARLLEWKLKTHKDPTGALVDLVSTDARQIGQLPLEVFTGTAALDEELNTASYQTRTDAVEIQPGGEPVTVSFAYTANSGVTFTKELTFWPDSYKVDATLKFSEPVPAGKSLSVTWGPGMGTNLGANSQLAPEVVTKPGSTVKLTREPVKKITEAITHANIEWAAISNSYFTAALFPAAPQNSLTLHEIALPPQADGKTREPLQQLWVGLTQPLTGGACQFTLYAGPKERLKLAAAHPGFEQLIDYGFFWFIAEPLATFMSYLYLKLAGMAIPSFLKSYGIVIICLTVVIKILFYPLTYKSFKSMKKMQDLQPKMKVIREKFKDRQQQQQETMKLYKEEKVNPMGGCLPMVLQIPVFFALYQTLAQSIELRGAAFLWIQDLSGPEPALLPLLKPLVLLMGVSMFLQQSMTPTTGDPRQAQLFKLMPIIFTAMFWNFPAGLVLYWLTNNVLTIGQQYLINKGGLKPAPTKAQAAAETPSLSRKRRKKGN